MSDGRLAWRPSDPWKVYRLTRRGRRWLHRTWRRRGGCGFSHVAEAELCRVLGPRATWPAELTLGEIADVSPLAEREVARYGWQYPGLFGRGFAEPDPRYDRRVRWRMGG